MRILMIFCAALVVALLPEQAFAWGAGVHLALGNSVLANLGCVPEFMAALLARHPNAFLYGCLSADIFIGKGTNFRPGHSHNWVTGFKLLKSASDARVLSYSYGYLTHLAADVVAHNYFVPNALAEMRSGSNLSHVYVELLADCRYREEHAKGLALLRQPNRAPDDTLLSTMEHRRLPFLIKKQLIKSSFHLTGRKTWGHSLRLADRFIPGPAANQHLDTMYTLAENLVFNFLKDPKHSPALSFDPIGSDNLRFVREHRLDRKRLMNMPAFTPAEELTTICRPYADPKEQERIALSS